MTLCFVICRFGFDVLPFLLLHVELSVLCTMLYNLNGANNAVEPRLRRNEEKGESTSILMHLS